MQAMLHSIYIENMKCNFKLFPQRKFNAHNTGDILGIENVGANRKHT